MPLENKKLRSTIIRLEEVDVALLKQCIWNTVLGGGSCGYRDRLYVFAFEGELWITRADAPESPVRIPGNQTGKAVDKFIESFVEELDCRLGDVTFHPTMDYSAPGVLWSFLKVIITAQQIMNPQWFLQTLNQYADSNFTADQDGETYFEATESDLV